jgi:hypothetical protein
MSPATQMTDAGRCFGPGAGLRQRGGQLRPAPRPTAAGACAGASTGAKGCLGKERHQAARFDELNQLSQPTPGSGSLPLTHPASPDGIVELLLAVGPVGHPVAADQHVKEQVDSQDRVAASQHRGGDVAVERERRCNLGGGGLH